MIRKAPRLAILVAAIALPAVANADTVRDNTYCDASDVAAGAITAQDKMHCEAMGMFRESHCHSCMARCARQAGKQLLPAQAEETFEGCADSCQQALDAALVRLNNRPRCSGERPPPDPEQCTAQLMRKDARNMFCHSRCMSRRNQDDCGMACDHRLHAAQDHICAKDVCKRGPAPPLSKDLCSPGQ